MAEYSEFDEDGGKPVLWQVGASCAGRGANLSAVKARVRAQGGEQMAAQVEVVDAEASVFLMPVPVQIIMTAESEGGANWTWTTVEFENGERTQGNPVEFELDPGDAFDVDERPWGEQQSQIDWMERDR